MIDKKTSVFFGLMNVVLFVYFLELVFPPITVYGDTAWICIFCLVIWFGLSFINEPAFYLNLNYLRIYLFVFLFCFSCAKEESDGQCEKMAGTFGSSTVRK